jgi:hypothetical protein
LLQHYVDSIGSLIVLIDSFVAAIELCFVLIRRLFVAIERLLVALEMHFVAKFYYHSLYRVVSSLRGIVEI